MMDAWEEFEHELHYYQMAIYMSVLMSLVIVYLCS
jgi:hypothetical protein